MNLESIDCAINLRETVEILPGNLPVVLTVPHDGEVTTLGGLELPFDFSSRKRDLYTRDIAQRTSNYLESRSGGNTPVIITQTIRRECLSYVSGAEQNYSRTVVLALQAMLAKNAQVLHLDIHGFGDLGKSGRANQDIVLGTKHCETISKAQEDQALARRLRDNGYEVVVPERVFYPWEKFTAEEPHTLMSVVSRAGFFEDTGPSRVIGMQIEIAGRHRNRDSTGRQRIAQVLGDFILEWSGTRE